MDAPGTEAETDHDSRAILQTTLRHLAVAGLLLLGVLIFFMVSTGSAAADTPVSGTISSDTTWTQAMSPIWVEGSVTVDGGATLTIDPGVEVRFNGFYTLTVQDGRLVADGNTAGAGPVAFTSNFTTPSAGNWNGIVFNGNLGGSVLDDVEIRYARTALTFNGVSVPVTSCVIQDIQWYGVWISGGTVPDYDLDFTGCTFQNIGIYGFYVSTLSNVALDLRVADSTFANYGTSALLFNSLQYANYSITVEGNSFNASNRAVYFASSALADVAEGNYFRFTFRNNWVNSSADSFGIYWPGDVLDFAETTVVFDGNQFRGQSGRSYGIYMDTFRGQTDFEHNFTLRIANNEFSDFLTYGVYLYQVYNFRNAVYDISGNTFQNQDAIVMDYGVFMYWAPYYGVDTEASSLSFTVSDNTALDLDDYVVYFNVGTVSGYRDVTIALDGNAFRNTGTFPYLDIGVYLRAFIFGDASVPSSFSVTVNGNAIQDLNIYGIYFSSSISGFRDVAIDIADNRFENTVSTWMDAGVYFVSSPSYTLSYPGSFALNVANSQFLNLSSYALRFVSFTSFTTVTMDVQGNDFSGSWYGFYLSGGVDNAEVLTFSFRNNVGTGIYNYMLYATGFSGISLEDSQASFVVSGNTVDDAPFGLYLGSISDYDLANTVLVENNVLTDISNTGIHLGWHDTTNSRVIVQFNTITGPADRAILLDGFDGAQSATVDIVSNTIQGAERGISVTYPAYDLGDTTLRILDNAIQGITGEGIYIFEVYRALAFIEIRGNVVAASPQAFASAALIVFDDGGSGWFQALADVDIVDNVLDGGLHAIYFEGTNGFGATLLVEISGITAVDTGYGVTLESPVGHAADIMNLRIRDSTFRDNPRGFLFLNQPGQGSLPIEVRGVQVVDYGAWGGYAFFMGSNSGAVIQIDVYASTFQGAQGNLGSVFAGSGPVTMNFYFIPGLGKGVSNGANQLIQTVWSVDVQVMVGRNFDQPARFGVQVSAVDQFGVTSFTAVTDADGMIRDQLVRGYVITNDGGTSYSGLAVQTLRADWGRYNGTVAASFTSNGTVTIYLPGDKDADGIADHMDPDENPEVSMFLDPRIAPYALHLWVLMGLVGAVLIPLSLWILRGKPLLTGKEKGGEGPPEPPEDYGGSP